MDIVLELALPLCVTLNTSLWATLQINMDPACAAFLPCGDGYY